MNYLVRVKHWGPWLLICLGLIGFTVGTLLLVNEQAVTKPSNVNIAHDPSSIKPSIKQIADYQVPLPDPKYIAIPAIGMPQTRVLALGLLKNDQIATPDNIYDTGWYKASSKPGQAGAMFIYGHVSSWTADGVFYNLKKLKQGDTISITTGSNKVYTYREVTAKTYPYKDVNMNQVLAPVQAKVPALNLMTCTGSVIPGTSEFNQRLVVFSSLVTTNSTPALNQNQTAPKR